MVVVVVTSGVVDKEVGVVVVGGALSGTTIFGDFFGFLGSEISSQNLPKLEICNKKMNFAKIFWLFLFFRLFWPRFLVSVLAIQRLVSLSTIMSKVFSLAYTEDSRSFCAAPSTFR